MNFKKIGLAAVIAASASSANAAWDSNGELILTVFNSATETSFSQELDVNTLGAQGLANGTTFNLNDLGLNHVAGNEADISWSVTGMSDLTGAGFAGLLDDSIYTTLTGAPAGGHGAGLAASTSRFTAYGTSLSNGTVVSEAGTQDAVLLSGGASAGFDNVWGESAANLTGETFVGATLSTAAGVNDSLYAYSFDIDFTGTAFDFPVTQSAYQWSLDLAGGNLVYGASVAPIPVPAAVWMFASGLIGLAGVARRNKKA